MRPYCLALGLVLAPLAPAQADEIDGLGSRAIDISRSFQPTTANNPQWGAAFAASEGIIVQSRYTEGTVDAVACTATVAFPDGPRRRPSDWGLASLAAAAGDRPRAAGPSARRVEAGGGNLQS